MLLQFTSEGDVYLFLSEFEKVYSMIPYCNLQQDM